LIGVRWLVSRGLMIGSCALCCGLLGVAGVAQAAAPTIGEQSSLDVSATSATLQAQVTPEAASEVSYRFEYDTSAYVSPAAHGQSAPSPEGSVPTGTSPVSVEAHVQGLIPATVYHFRVVATNAAHEVAYGADETFTTPVSGGEFALPDGRMWEMVSPVDKHGARVNSMTYEGGVIQAAEDGSAITYVASAPIVSDPEGNPTLAESQVISMRGSGGWSSRDIATPHEVPTHQVPVSYLAEYDVFSPDLSRGVIFRYKAQETPLSPEASEPTIYLREGLRESAVGKYVALVNNGNVLAGAKYGVEGALEFQGASSNLEHILLSSGAPLTKNAAESSLYEWTAGALQLVSILPKGESRSTSPGFHGNKRGAVSDNGRRVFFETETREEGPNRLFMRDLVGGEKTVQLDLPQGVVSPETSENTEFQYATPDGARVYFTDTQILTPDAAGKNIKLYEYDALTGALTDLTSNGVSVQGLIEVSESGEYVYFVANGPSGDELYVAHLEQGKVTTSLVAELSGDDHPDWGGGGGLDFLTSRVSPNGRYLAFMSDRSLTGYNNTDAVSGAADEEVFVYDAVTKHLVCASCDPTGARPHGVFDTEHTGEGIGLLVDRPQVWENRWLAGSVPGWTAYKESNGALYQSRYLSNEGRLFFDSADSLVAQDTNGREDVYEYEPEGVDCGSGSQSASEVYKGESGAESAGCVALISSGSSSEESAFLDASGRGPGGEEGEDVFFLTSAKLSSQDVDTADDVYDAHICSSVAPCTSAPAASPPCTTTDSCRVAPAAQPSIFGAPSSATFSGAGNVVQQSSNVVVKSKLLTGAQKLAVALEACKKDRSKPKRASCEKRARKRYGTKAKAKKSIRGGK
jgi:hypothetical protein